MDSEPTTMQVGEPECRHIEGKLTVESRECLGGDWAKNIGGANKEKRVTFEGCMTSGLYVALIDAIARMVDA